MSASMWRRDPDIASDWNLESGRTLYGFVRVYDRNGSVTYKAYTIGFHVVNKAFPTLEQAQEYVTAAVAAAILAGKEDSHET